MAKNHGSSIKDDEQYEALRKQGESKEKTAAIANSNRHSTAKKGGKSGSYDDWSKEDLQKRAGEIGIDGRSKMNKSELIDALPTHSTAAWSQKARRRPFVTTRPPAGLEPGGPLR